MSSRSQRSTISPFLSRKSTPPTARPSIPSYGRPITPSSSTTPSSRPPSKLSTSSSSFTSLDRPASTNSKENVTVTVRFRPLSVREINKGDEIAWYADGDHTVRNEYNVDIAYGFDKVFGPATTTRHVYDVAAQHVVSGAMQGINGTVFAYGVTSSGKTHTMHGEQKSPGIIPLAVKDVFGIIQETPGREFLLRVSYLEIYNEVINDLLDPTGQNLRIREDVQGTYVEGIKEEVVLSPAHALSLIATGEEHRHVGSNNFNLLSSRSHTIFTLTIESSPHGEVEGEDVTLSQLHLIDLAGSESSKTETTGLRRKEGSYINKSLLTLGTVISKLTDVKATHVPYRDSKLTRLLQSSLSGHGRVSLICTVTPASSNTEETHNTLKFAHRSKHVEIKASQNKIMDEKSLIKKYQTEISSLKQELQQLKCGMMEKPTSASDQEDLINLKLQLEAGQMKLQSRLEEEEQAKAALMGRIQRLTKLILVSTKTSMSSSLPEKTAIAIHRRRHSFREDELSYLPDRKREYLVDDDTESIDSEFSSQQLGSVTNLDELVKEYKKNRKGGMLGWFKFKKPDNMAALSLTTNSDSSASGSPSSSSRSVQNKVSRRGDNFPVAEPFPELTQAGELFSAAVRGGRLPQTGTTIVDQMDLLREQIKMLAGEVALCTSSLRRLSEQAANNPTDPHLQEQRQKLNDDICEKKHHIRLLEQRMTGSVEKALHTISIPEMSEALSKLTIQLSEKTFELEIKAADNRILQEQLQMKMSEKAEMEGTILSLRQQMDSVVGKSCSSCQHHVNGEISEFKTRSEDLSDRSKVRKGEIGSVGAYCFDEITPTSVMSLNRIFSQEDSKECCDILTNSQNLGQAAEIESLKQENLKLAEEKDGLDIQCIKLSEEASYAKELAAAAAAELRNLAEEVTRLSYQNAKLTGDLVAAKETYCRSCSSSDSKQSGTGSRLEMYLKKPVKSALYEEMQKELSARCQREASLQTSLFKRDQLGEKLQREINEAKRREEELENELANMWVLVAKMRNSRGLSQEVDPSTFPSCSYSKKMFKEDSILENTDEDSSFADLRASCMKERRCKDLEKVVSRLKVEDVGNLDITNLEELRNLHAKDANNMTVPC